MTAKVFQSNMILQGGRPFKIWGSAEPSSAVELKISGGGEAISRSCIAGADGCYEAEFPAIAPSFSEYTIEEICGGKTQRLDGIVFGDVFLLAGQSNMELKISYVDNNNEHTITGKNDFIRTLTLGNAFPSEMAGYDIRPFTPQDDIADFRWRALNAEEQRDISALGYYFATEMTERVGYPVGYIDTSCGGARIFAYIPIGAESASPSLCAFMREHDLFATEENYNTKEGKNFTQQGGIYNEKIHPIRKLRFKALLWYQGESDLLDYDGSGMYGEAFAVMADSLRRSFEDNLPIFAAEIASLRYISVSGGVCKLGEALTAACERLSDAYVLPTYDIFPEYLVLDGSTEYHPLHPVNKRAYAEKFICSVISNLYDNRLCKSPVFESCFEDGGGVYVRFKVAAPFNIGERIHGFFFRDGDGDLRPCLAETISSDTVRLAVPEKTFGIGYAHFLYADCCNLKDSAGTYAAEFCTAEVGEYKPYLPFMLISDKVPVCAFWPENGGYRKVASWTNGRLFSSDKNRVTPYGGGVTAQFKRDNPAYFLFGLSPARCVNGSEVNFSKYSSIRLKIICSVEVQFHGLHLFDGKETLKFPPVGCRENTLYLDLKKGENTVYVDLTRCIDAFNCLSALPTFIGEMQFTFRAMKGGRLDITEIELLKRL